MLPSMRGCQRQNHALKAAENITYQEMEAGADDQNGAFFHKPRPELHPPALGKPAYRRRLVRRPTAQKGAG